MNSYEYVYSLISSLAGGNVFLSYAPLSTAYPLLIYERTGGANVQSVNGSNALVQSSWRFQCWAETAIAAVQLAEGVKTSLAPEKTVLTLELSDKDEVSDKYRVMLFFNVWHTET